MNEYQGIGEEVEKETLERLVGKQVRLKSAAGQAHIFYSDRLEKVTGGVCILSNKYNGAIIVSIDSIEDAKVIEE